MITHLKLDKYFFFNESDVKDILLLRGPNPRHSREEKTEVQGAEVRVRIRRRVGKLPLPFYWPPSNHWRINWMIYDQDYPTNGTLKTVISCFTESWMNDDMDNIELAGIFHASAGQRSYVW